MMRTRRTAGCAITIHIAPGLPAGMGEKSDDRDSNEKPKARRLFTGSRSWIPSSGKMEMPAKSWPKEE